MVSRGLCFDLDGTLIDSGRKGLKRLLGLAVTRNLSLTPETEQRIRGMWGSDPIKLLQTIWPDENPQAFFIEWENLDNAEPHLAFPGTRESLEKLSPHFNMSIVTNRAFRTIMNQLLYNDIAQFFGLIITPEYNGHKKPEPEIMEPVLKRYKDNLIEPENVILVGDTVAGDWKLAQAIGLEFYAVLCGGVDSRKKFLAAGVPENHIINSVVDLPKILLKILS